MKVWDLALLAVVATAAGAAVAHAQSSSDVQQTSQVLPAVDVPVADSAGGVLAAAATAPQAPHLKAVSEKESRAPQLLLHAETQRMRQAQQSSVQSTQVELPTDSNTVPEQQPSQQQKVELHDEQQQQQLSESEKELEEKVNHAKMGTAVEDLLSKMPAAAAAITPAAPEAVIAADLQQVVAADTPQHASTPAAAAAADATAAAAAAVLEVAAAPAAYTAGGSEVVSFKVSEGPLPSHIISVSESQARVINDKKAAGNAATRPAAAAAGAAAWTLLAAALCYVL